MRKVEHVVVLMLENRSEAGRYQGFRNPIRKGTEALRHSAAAVFAHCVR